MAAKAHGHMKVQEPILTDDDKAVWDAWMRAAGEHARTRSFARKVERARVAIIEACEWVERHPVPNREGPIGASASSGKDSTVMLDIIANRAGCKHVVAVTQQDDLDYPGVPEFTAARAARLGIKQHLIVPSVSAKEWIAEAAKRGELACYDDVHTRAAGLSKNLFYPLMEADNKKRPLAFLGLRREESRNRDRVASWAARDAWERRETQEEGPNSGLTRWHKGTAHWRCYPLMDFTGIDVYAYAARYDVPLLHVYRCVGLMHREDPSRVRVAWWLPAGHTADGQAAWLRRYYPSLHRQLVAWMPETTLFS